MKYAHILAAFATELFAVDPIYLGTIIAFLADQAAGEKYDEAELEARIGRSPGTDAPRPRANAPRVAMLPVRGFMANRVPQNTSGGGFSAEQFRSDLQSALRNDSVEAIVLDVNTNGGLVSGNAEVAEMVFASRGQKPIIAHVDSTAASMGYWVASGADEIVLTPTAGVGSIGILSAHDDLSAAFEKRGVKTTLISAGKFKTDGNPFGPLSEESLARRQASVNRAYDRFVGDVARNRGVAVDVVRNGFGEGGMVEGADAVAQGMADSVGSLDDVLQRFGVSLYPPRPVGGRSFAPARERRALSLRHT